MTPERHAEVKALFLAVCGLPNAARGDYLHKACRHDTALRAAVDLLLKNHGDPATLTSDDVTRVLEATLTIEPGPGAGGSSGRLASAGADATGRGFSPGLMIAGRYRIVARLGAGGMGEVYRAEDLKLGQTVALKFLAQALAREPAWLERLHAEVRVAREIAHPNVCRVYDIGEHGGDAFISMEYVPGEDLKSLLIRIGRLPPDKALEIARQLCAGLAAAHAKGVLHRDLKPANIMLDDQGQIRLMDFGLAAIRADISGFEIFAGTPAYMAPEQLLGRDVSVRSDLYSLGLVLYELFTGRPAFRADTRSGFVREHRQTPPLLPSSVVADVNPVVERIILRCLTKAPKARPPSALAVAAALPGSDVLADALAAGETPSPELVAAAGRGGGLAWPQAVGLLVATAALVVSGMWLTGRAYAPELTLDKAPVVLAERARVVAARLGYSFDGASEAYDFSTELACKFVELAGAPNRGVQRQYAVADGELAVFWYRCAATSLAPQAATTLVFGDGRVQLDDPALVRPGMMALVLSGSGRLVGYLARPATSSPTTAPHGVDWSPLLEAAQLDEARLTPATPALRPLVYGEEQVAWEAPDPTGRDVHTRVEAAARQGQPTFFAVVREGTTSAVPAFRNAAVRTGIRRAAWSVLLTVLVVTAAPLAYFNLRGGRGDRGGAFRVAAFTFGLQALGWMLQACHVPDLLDELERVALAACGWLGESVMVWIFYLALEPYVRRFWPQTLITWSRVVAGTWRDPRVGRDVLVGLAAGAFWFALGGIDERAPAWFGLVPRDPVCADIALQPLMGARQACAVTFSLVQEAVYRGLFFLLALVLLRIVLRRPVMAGVVCVIILMPLYLPVSSHPATSWLILGVGGAGIGVALLMRWGLLCVVVGLFASRLLGVLPVSFPLGRWYGDVALFAIALFAALATFALVYAVTPEQDVRRAIGRTTGLLEGSTGEIR